MRRTTLILALALPMSACINTTWVKPSATDADRAQDLLVCEYEAEKVSAGIRNGLEAGWVKGDLTQKCMGVKGWTRERTK